MFNVHSKTRRFQAWMEAVGRLSTAPKLRPDRIIPRFHLEGVEAGRRVSVFKIDPGTGERLGLLATAEIGDVGWVDLPEPIIVKAGDAFIAVPESASR